jgi:hypothetical protein
MCSQASLSGASCVLCGETQNLEIWQYCLLRSRSWSLPGYSVTFTPDKEVAAKAEVAVCWDCVERLRRRDQRRTRRVSTGCFIVSALFASLLPVVVLADLADPLFYMTHLLVWAAFFGLVGLLTRMGSTHLPPPKLARDLAAAKVLSRLVPEAFVSRGTRLYPSRRYSLSGGGYPRHRPGRG